MTEPDDPLLYELCFPGALFGETEIECPHCGELLTVPVEDPLGQDSFRCCECQGAFDVDWGRGVLAPIVSVDREQ